MSLPACRSIGSGMLAAVTAWTLLGGLPADASAQRCEQDDDCPDKFTCEVTGAIECPTSKPCPEGEECEAPASCEPEDLRECVSPSCNDDGDCPSDMVCYEQTSTQCGGSTPGCDPSGECPDPRDAGEPECSEKTERSCVPPYVPPCTDDADCGEGFKCEEESISMCSGGSGGRGTGTGGAASSLDGGQASPPDSASQCTTTRTGKFHCVLQPLPCEDESDCPDAFSCEDDPNQSTCVDTEPAAGSDADDSRCPDASSSRTKSCLPPYYDLKGVGRGEQGGSTDGSGQGSTEKPPTTPSSRKERSDCSATPGEPAVTIVPIAVLGLLCFALGIRATRRLAPRRTRPADARRRR